MRDRGGFIAGGDDGGDWWPGVRGFVLRDVVIEFAEAPEVTACDGEVEPDGEGEATHRDKCQRHRPFCIGGAPSRQWCSSTKV